nr:hypothetical protein CPGR_00412 [Mycolicibacter nonchromogenicus]
MQFAAVGDLGAGGCRGHLVAVRREHVGLVGLHEQAVRGGVDAAGRHGRQHQAALLAQGGHRRAGNGDVQAAGRTGDQRSGDVADVAVGVEALRPGDGGGGLLDREQWGDAAQQHAGDTGRHRDQPSDSMALLGLVVGGGHEARCYATAVAGRGTHPARPGGNPGRCRAAWTCVAWAGPVVRAWTCVAWAALWRVPGSASRRPACLARFRPV